MSFFVEKKVTPMFYEAIANVKNNFNDILRYF